MIDQFILPNIKQLIDMRFHVDVACNFMEGSNCSDEKIYQLRTKLDNMGVGAYQINFDRNVFNIKKNFKSFQQVLALIRAQRYKFIHCHSPIGGLCGRLAGHISHTKVLYTAHGFHFYNGSPIVNWIVYYPIEKFLSQYTNVLITINKEDYEIAQTFHASKVEYIPGVGIDTDKIKSTIINCGQKRKELGIPEGSVVLLSVGELNKNKNHLSVIRAVAKLRDTKIYYIIAGQGSLSSFLVEEVRRLKIEKQVGLLGYRNDIYELCKCADIFVHTSLREGLGIAPLEGMASGLPLISSYVGGIKDYTVNGITGICIVDPLNVDEITEAIITLMHAPNLMAECGTNNKKIADRFSLKTSLDATRQIYERISEDMS